MNVTDILHVSNVKRHAAPSGNRDNDWFQAECSCDWKSQALHSNRTIEGYELAERDARDHTSASNRRPADR